MCLLQTRSLLAWPQRGLRVGGALCLLVLKCAGSGIKKPSIASLTLPCSSCVLGRAFSVSELWSPLLCEQNEESICSWGGC